MHWILDTAFEEDRCRNRTGSAPLTLNVFRKMGNFFFSLAKKTKKYKEHSIKRLVSRCKSQFSHLIDIFALA